MEDNIEQQLDELREQRQYVLTERNELDRRLSLLDTAIQALQAIADPNAEASLLNAHFTQNTGRKYLGWKLRDAMIDYLSTRNQDTIDSLISSLLADGASFGKGNANPRRVAAITITRNSNILELCGNVVALKRGR